MKSNKEYVGQFKVRRGREDLRNCIIISKIKENGIFYMI